MSYNFLVQIKNKIELIDEGETLIIKMDNYDPFCIQKIKKLGSRFDVENKYWITDIKNKLELDEFFSQPIYDYTFSKTN